MLTIEALKEYGADTEGGLRRCMGNEELYLKLVATVPGDGKFNELEDAINTGDQTAAFEAVHALKGVLGNLALTPLYEKASEITEFLRAGAEEDYSSLIKELKASRDALAQLIG